mgnify:CR=1 FL=1
MKTLGNIIWFVFGGAIAALLWLVLGILLLGSVCIRFLFPSKANNAKLY